VTTSHDVIAITSELAETFLNRYTMVLWRRNELARRHNGMCIESLTVHYRDIVEFNSKEASGKSN